MYDVMAVKRKIEKEGIEKTILDLSSKNLSDDVKKELINSHILCNGYPNLSLICYL